MDDLRVIDEHYGAYIQAITSYGEVAEEQITEYLRILAAVCDKAITEGSVAKSLKTFALHATNLKGRAQEMCELIQSSNKGFLEAIDQADEYLY